MNNQIKGQTVIKGAMFLAAASFISHVIGLLYKVPLTNILGDEGMAIYSSAFSIYALLLTFSAIGIPSAISKLISERIATGHIKNAQRVFKVALVYTTLIGTTTACLLWVGAEQVSLFIANNTTLTMPLRALAPTLIIVSMIAIVRGYFQGMGNMAPSAVSQVIEQVFNATFAIVLAYTLSGHGVIAAATGATFGPGIGALISLGFLIIIYGVVQRRFYKQQASQTTETIQTQTKESTRMILKQILLIVVPILLTSSVFSITTTIDQKMLYAQLPVAVNALLEEGEEARLPIHDIDTLIATYDTRLQDTSEETLNLPTLISQKLVGQYMGKYVTLLNLPVSLIVQLATAAIPAVAAAMMLKDYMLLRKRIYTVLSTGIMLAVPAAIGLSVFGEVIVPLLFSSAPDGGRLILYGGIGVIPMALAQLSGGMLQGMGKQRIPVKNALIACALKIIFNALFLMNPYCHIYSVIYSTTICYCIYAFLNIRALNHTINLEIKWHTLIGKPVIAASVMGVIAYSVFYLLNRWQSFTFIWLTGAIGVGVIVYFVVLLLIGGLTKEILRTIPGGNILSKWAR